jgi:succinyl-CoA synthetase beta subunit
MNLHEYQSKTILKKFGISVPEGILCHTVEEAVKGAEIIQESTSSDKCVIKAQIHAGGRGKGGGVKVARTPIEVRLFAGQIIGMQLITPQTSALGKKVRKVLVEQNIYYPGPTEPAEFYLSVLLNREKGHTALIPGVVWTLKKLQRKLPN